MRAVRYERTGAAAEVLQLADVDRPDPAPGEVRVKLSVSGVNPTDWKQRTGTTAGPPEGWRIPHHDGAGVIDAVGAGVATDRMGERVWVWMAGEGGSGTAAQWTVVPSAHAMPLPEEASFDLGAALGVPAVTAHRCLFAAVRLTGRTY